MLFLRLKKLTKRLKLSCKIELCEIKISPYSYYKKNQRKYLVNNSLSRYSEYIRYNVKCNVKNILASN